MNTHYDAIIIGAGVGGLTCGNLLAKHGKNILMIEQHSLPGGYCTSYKKKGYMFDVPCIIGSMRKGEPVAQLLSYIGVYDKIEFLEIEKLAKIIGPDIEIDWYIDTYKLEYEFIDKFPQNKKDIQTYFREIRMIWDEICNAHYKPSFWQRLVYPFRFPKLVKYNNYTMAQLLDKFFTNPQLKELLGKEAATLALSKDEVSALLYIGYIMGYAAGGIWYPKGGFQKISDALAESFSGYGGHLKLNTKVTKILVESKKAFGVELENGQQITAEYIVSNADSKKTYLELIEPAKVPRKLRKKIEACSSSFSGTVVKLAVNMEMPEFVNYAWIFSFPEYGIVKKMFNTANKNGLDLSNYGFSIDTAALIDKETCPGVSIINITILPVSYHYNNRWLSSNKKDYQQLKEDIANNLIQSAEKYLPGLSKNILAMDISTPLTYERYTSATNGGWYDLALTPSQSCNNRIGPDTPIKNLYSTGGKSVPGPGLNAAIPAGLYTADMILKGSLTKGLSYIDPTLL
jgi:phytoene dehydrogenase-like protein